MNVMPTSITETPRIDGVVSEHLLAHLTAEESSLAAMLGAVRSVHQALRHLDDDRLREALESEAQIIAAAGALQQQRGAVREELAAALGVAQQEATLGRVVAATTGALRDSVDRFRKSLAEMSVELEKLNRQNGAMIRQSLALARGIIGRLTGQRAVGDSYDAGGNREEAHVGPMVQWGG